MTGLPWRSPPATQDLEAARETLVRILVENIEPFWYPSVLDTKSGGYRLNHDEKGRWLGPAPKRVVMQARVLWFFSRLSRSPFGAPHHLDAARHGYRYLRDHMWDDRDGGVFWDVALDGTPRSTLKSLYAQSFALFALSEYAEASGDPTAATLAQACVEYIGAHFRDPTYGAFFQCLRRDGTMLLEGERSERNDPPGTKCLNSHMHLAEAVIHQFRRTGDPALRDWLEELVVILSSAFFRPREAAFTDRHRRDLSPMLAPPHDEVVYGHDVENLSLICQAATEIGRPIGSFDALLHDVFSAAYRHGYDRQSGGFHVSGPLGAAADQRQKIWWVQAEGLQTALYLSAVTGEQRYWRCFHGILEWIVGAQIDWEHGEWHASIAPDGTSSGQKADDWKGPYHTGRAMIDCIEWLDDAVAQQADGARSVVSPLQDVGVPDGGEAERRGPCVTRSKISR